jgi:hypothetical protein
MPPPPPHSLGHRRLSTQTPEIPEYWRELPVKVPWRSTGDAADAAFSPFDDVEPYELTELGKQLFTTR